MAVLSDVRTSVLNLLGTEASLSNTEIDSLINTRYAHLYETFHWSRRTRDFVISLVAQVESGTSDTVTVTNASATITSAGTPFTSAMTGRQIQIGTDEQYFFFTYVSSSSGTLSDGEGNSTTWPGATASGQSWRIFKTLYTIPSDAQSIISIAADYPLEELDGGRERLDRIDPDRSTTGSEVTHWIYAGVNSSNVREVEVWPVPTQARILRGQYLREAPTLTTNSTIDVPVPMLVYGAAADACHLLHAKQGSQEPMWADKALFFERKQREVADDYKFVDFNLTSPPRQLGRRPKSGGLMRGTDWAVSHDTDLV